MSGAIELDLAGAAVLSAYTRHKILKDYGRGEGEDSAKAAMLVHGAGALRHGSDGLISLGGMYGVNVRSQQRIKSNRETRTVRNDWGESCHSRACHACVFQEPQLLCLAFEL